MRLKNCLFLSIEYNTFKLIEKGFWSETCKICGPGESAAMALAHLNNGILASNNLSDVSEYVSSLDIMLVTSSMILSRAFEKDIVSENEANALWKNMQDEGILLPEDTFSDYYNRLFKMDCEEFFKGNSIGDYI